MFPGPTIRRPTGQTTTVTLVNDLPPEAGDLTLHNHGNHSTPENDGQPDDRLAANGGGSVTYTYTGTENGGNERGAMQWYHDHRMTVTGRNVWMGLAGMYIIDDPADPQTLPKGAFDVPLMLTDRSFDANNQIRYNPSGNVGPDRQPDPGQRRAAAVLQRRRPQVPPADPQRVERALVHARPEQRPGVHPDRHRIRPPAGAGQAHEDRRSRRPSASTSSSTSPRSSARRSSSRTSPPTARCAS